MKQSSAANPHRDPGDIGTAAAAAVTSTTAPRSAEFGQEEFQTPISTPRGIFNGRREDATLESTESSVTVRTPPQTITSQSHVQVAVTLPSTHADSRKSLDSYKSAREEDDRCLLPQHPPLETIAASHAISFESITGAVGPADPAIFAAASTSPRAPPVTARNSIVNIGLDASFPMFTPNIITATPTTSAPNIRTPSRQPSIPELPALTSIGAQKPGSLPTDVAMGTQPSANKNAPGNRPVAPDTVSSDRMPRRAPPARAQALPAPSLAALSLADRWRRQPQPPRNPHFWISLFPAINRPRLGIMPSFPARSIGFGTFTTS
ncbi:hypothetical protein BC828DRAFT_290829 [Blastocladiella britannica]|nr:hypothetical protein BC828DRAFT_290829 [Blastocladiella britannica]